MQTVNKRKKFSSGVIHFFLESISLVCRQIALFQQLGCNFLVGAFLDLRLSMLELQNSTNFGVEKTIYFRFVQKIRRQFFVKWIQFQQTGNSFFDRHKLLLSSKYCKNIFIGDERLRRCGIVENCSFKPRQHWQLFFPANQV